MFIVQFIQPIKLTVYDLLPVYSSVSLIVYVYQ